MQWGTTRVSENASCWYSLTPPTVRNRLKVALNALSLHRWRKETPRHVTRPPAFTEREREKKRNSASSVLWLQTHFLRQSTVLNFKMSSPISWSAVSVKTSSLSVHQQLLDKQYLPEHGSSAWKCVNSCCSNPVNSQWTTESRWELQVFLYWYFLLFHPREL